MSRNGWYFYDEANNAKIYVGDKLCGTMPNDVYKSTLYTFDCQAVGDYIKIVTGRNDSDQKLSFSYVKVFNL